MLKGSECTYAYTLHAACGADADGQSATAPRARYCARMRACCMHAARAMLPHNVPRARGMPCMLLHPRGRCVSAALSESQFIRLFVSNPPR